MGAHHDHDHVPDIKLSQAARVSSIVLLAIVAVVTLIGLVWLWPSERVVTIDPNLGPTRSTTPVVAGRITEIGPCQGDEAPTDDSIYHRCQLAKVVLTSGPDEGKTVSVELIGVAAMTGVGPGDPVRVSAIDESGGDQYALMTVDRLMPLLILTILLVVVVVGIAGWKGVRGLVGLVVAGTIFFGFVLPSLASGNPAIPVALVGTSAMMFAVLYLAHGISMRTTSAFIGTLISLLATAALGIVSVRAARLSGLSSEETIALAGQTNALSFSGLLACSLIIAGLGVLNDTTITQASAVWELRAAGPHLTRWELFNSGMRIGRDHIASMIYTIVFAYAGAAMSTLLLLTFHQQPIDLLLSTEPFAEEIVRTIGSSIGLVLSVPLTTAVAALTVGGATEKAPADTDDEDDDLEDAPLPRRAKMA